MGFPLLQKSGETCQGRQIGVSEKYWNFNRDRMQWVGGGAPSQTIKLQEMGVDGQVITELGGSNDDKMFTCSIPFRS